MPKASKRARSKQAIQPQYFIFEIGETQPTYILSVDHDRYRKSSYREHAGIEFQAVCVFPKKLAGRPVSFNLAGERGCLTPEAFQRDSSWKPRCVGSLEVKPDHGNFYTSVPHESLSFLATLFLHRDARFVVLYGEPLTRGKSLCSSVQLEKIVNLEDY